MIILKYYDTNTNNPNNNILYNAIPNDNTNIL